MYAGNDETGPQIGHLCRSSTGSKNFTSEGNTMYVVFSAGYWTAKGFTASYKTLDGGK